MGDYIGVLILVFMVISMGLVVIGGLLLIVDWLFDGGSKR